MKKREEMKMSQEKRYLSAQDTILQSNLNKLTEATNWYRKEKVCDGENEEKEKGYNFDFSEKNKERWKENNQSWKGWRLVRKVRKKKKKLEGMLEDEKTCSESKVEKLQSVISSSIRLIVSWPRELEYS